MRKEKTVAVLSRNYSNGLAVARSLGAAGYTVDFIANMHKAGAMDVALRSKYIRNRIEVVSAKLSAEEGDPLLLDAILEYAQTLTDKALLFPTDDYTTTIMDLNRDQLSEYFLMPSVAGGGNGDLSALMDKITQSRMARELGLLTPESCKVSLRDKEISIPEDIKYPCYVKPLRSIEGYKTEMAVCSDREELLVHLMKMREDFADRDVMVQEYLEIEQEYASAGVCLDQEVILPAMIRKTRVGQYGRGVTLTGELVDVDVLGSETAAKAFELLRSLHYTGNFGMEFNLAGGRLYFNEINLRSAGESYAYFRSGANLPAIFADHVFGIQAEEDPENEFFGIGKTLMYDKIAWEDYIRGNITSEELDRCLEETDFKVLLDDEDPAPGELFLEHNEDDLRRKERIRRRRLECIMASMADRGWDHETAEAELDKTRERLGITYRDYKKYKFWKMNPLRQFEVYDRIMENREIRKERGTKAKPVVVVLASANAEGLSAVRAIGSRGYPVDLIANVTKKNASGVMAASRHNRIAVEIVSRRTQDGMDEDVLNELMEYRERGKRRLILYPADAYAARVAEANRSKLKRAFRMPGFTDDETTEGIDRTDISFQKQLAADAGLNIRKEYDVSLDAEEITLPEGLIYPVVCEPTEWLPGLRSESLVCEDEEMLLEHLGFLRDKEPHRGAVIREYRQSEYYIEMSGVCFDQEVIIPACVKVETISSDPDGGAVRDTLLPVSEGGVDPDKVADMMRMLHYTGPFTAVFGCADGRMWFNRIRFCGSNDRLYLESGVNLPVIFIRGLLGRKISDQSKEIKTYGKTLVYERTVWNDFNRGYLDKTGRDAALESADIRLIESEEDPEPAELFRERLQEEQERKKKKKVKPIKQLKKTIRKSVRSSDFLQSVAGNLYLRLRGYPQGKRSNRRDPESGKERVLIAGRNWGSNLCMAKSVGEAGYEAEVLHIFPRRPKKTNLQRWLKPEKYSSFVKAYYALDAKNKEKRIVERLIKIADPDRKMLLIPADDLVASTIDEYYYDLKDYYIMPTINGKGGELSRLMSKEAQKELAKAAGLPVLNSCVISSEGDLVIPDTVTYPCFIKPNISKNGLKTKMMRCDSEEELLAVLNSRKAQGFEMLVEDYADIGRELSYLGLSTVDGIVCPGYFEAVIEGEGSHRGVALLGRLLPVEQAEPLRSEVMKFIESLNYNGLFDVDLIETKDGKVYFVELNLRYGGSGFALTRAGVNLPGMYCDYMLKGKPIDMDCSIGEAGQTFVSEKVLLDEFREGLVEFDRIEEIMSMADIHFTQDEADMGPFRHLEKNYETAKRLREDSERRAEEKTRKREEKEQLAREEYLRRMESRAEAEAESQA